MDSADRHGPPDFGKLRRELDSIRSALREQELDAWLLYDLHARNGVASRLLGLGDLTRRYFVVVPARGEPHAVVHGIEEAPWAAWPWPRTSYVGWRELERTLRSVLRGLDRVAMEVSPGDAVPPLDLVPAGVKELVEAAGARVVPSGELVSRFHSRWSAAGLASHRRAAAALAEVAAAAFARTGAALVAGEDASEGALRGWVLDRLRQRGVGVGADCIVAAGANAGDPHYQPRGTGAVLRPGQVLLLDLWGKESDDAVFADQTWMAYLGAEAPDRVEALFAAVRDARDAAIAFIAGAWREGRVVQGYEVDDVARGLLAGRGHGDAFVHRTGHSIDGDLHGAGPNLDNLETRETRRLIPGIGFSVEPGLYFQGELGLRSEVNVFMGDEGPEVTTPAPQTSVAPLLRPA